MASLLGTERCVGGYLQLKPSRRQGEQVGLCSLHLTRRRLQLKHPRRDLKWKRRRTTTVPDESTPDPTPSPSASASPLRAEALVSS